MRLALPTKKQVCKWSLGVLGAILIGAFGSGVWQSILGPGIHASTRWVLDLASLGLTSYKNGVYEQIAADNQSRASVETLHLTTVIFQMLALVGLQVLFIFRNSVRRKAMRLSERISGASTDSAPANTAEIKTRLEANVRSLDRLRWFMYALTVFTVAILCNDSIKEAKFSYMNSADAHFHQVLHIASPYLDVREKAEVESDFAQVGSRDDYVRLLSRLEGQCKARGKKVPKFDPW